jgi:hypothetical protein
MLPHRNREARKAVEIITECEKNTYTLKPPTTKISLNYTI